MFKTGALDSVADAYVDEVGVTPGTRLEADDRNITQDELINAVEGSGQTLDAAGVFTNNDQLFQAMTIMGRQGKNALNNSAMLHAQRGASGSASFDSTTIHANNDDTYLLDRWNLLSDGNDIVDVSQSTEIPVGALLSCALEVETINKKFGKLQVIEQKNCAHMIGGVVSLSFEALVTDITKLDNIKAAVISWSGTADVVTSDIISTWNAEDTTPTLSANWTFENTPANLSVTDAWTGGRYKIENISIDTSNAKNIGVFIWSDGFCDTLANIFRFTNVQLEKNSIATDYAWHDVSIDLAGCQRRYGKSYAQDVVPGAATTDNICGININQVANSDHTVGNMAFFKVTMAGQPSVTLYDAAGNSGKVTMAAGNNINGTVVLNHDTGSHGSGANGAVATDRVLQFHYEAVDEL